MGNPLHDEDQSRLLAAAASVRPNAYVPFSGYTVGAAVLDEQGRIHLKDGRQLPEGYRQFTHGYAVTAHKSQGRSVDHVVILADRMARDLFYVAVSRGRC